MKLGYRMATGVRGVGDDPAGPAASDGMRRASRMPTALAALALSALAAAQAGATVAHAEACPNEALRLELRSAGLPDCRAYERVTPAYKESEPALVSNVFAVSPDGSRVIDGSVGAFGGAEQAALGLDSKVADTAYLLERSAGGWAAVSLAPRASEYANTGSDGLYDASADLGLSVWELGSVVGGAELSASFEGHSSFYLEHNPVAGSSARFEKIGSPTPNLETTNDKVYDYLGASADLSHILFSSPPGYRWPFDKTIDGAGTLYEYVGTESSGEAGSEPSGEPRRRPVLVGVSGGSGSSALISTCGTRLGSSSPEEVRKGSVYNAISESGERVFFTAGAVGEAHEACKGPQVAELFTREEVPRHEGESPTAVVRTVPVSEPSREACGECRTENRRAAFFQGASLDGSEVFFTTEQELLPGAKGNNLYKYDFQAPAGARVALVSGGSVEADVQGVSRISEDGSHVYFVAKGDLTGASRNEYGEVAREGEDNLYVYEQDAQYPDGRTLFIADLVPGGESAGGDEADWQLADERPVLASEEGRYLVFTSTGDLTHEGVEPGKRQVFQYDASTGALVRASIGQDGYNNDNRTQSVGVGTGGALSSPKYLYSDSPVLTASTQASADGSVFFSSPDALVPGALSDQYDSAEQYDPATEELVSNVYEYRAGQVYLLSDGRDLSTINGLAGTQLIGWDSTGRDVFFFTSDSLVPEDEDTQSDLYDARVEGGFPTPVAPAGCGGASCQGVGPAPPPLPGTPASIAASGEGAPVPATVVTAAKKTKRTLVRCAKGRRVGHGKCVSARRKARARVEKAKRRARR